MKKPLLEQFKRIGGKLAEGYAWERQPGKPLPTLKDVQKAHEANSITEAPDDVTERIDMLYDAQEKLGETIELIRQALKGTSREDYAESYILGHLENWIDATGYDIGIEQYIDELRNYGIAGEDAEFDD